MLPQPPPTAFCLLPLQTLVPAYSLPSLLSDLGLAAYLPRFEEAAISLDMLLHIEDGRLEALVGEGGVGGGGVALIVGSSPVSPQALCPWVLKATLPPHLPLHPASSPAPPPGLLTCPSTRSPHLPLHPASSPAPTHLPPVPRQGLGYHISPKTRNPPPPPCAPAGPAPPGLPHQHARCGVRPGAHTPARV